MDSQQQTKPRKTFDNVLFAFLGAMTAVVMSLAVFGEIDNRSPASVQGDAPVNETFDARIYIGE